MSHLIIKPFDQVYVPAEGQFNSTWHRLETSVQGGIAQDGSNIPDVLQPIAESGFKPDFDAPISTPDPELAEHLKDNPITDWKVLLADLRQSGNGVIPVHVVKKSYKVHQNRALFDAMIAAACKVLGVNGFEIATVGTLGAFSQFFVSLFIKGEGAFKVGVDDFASFFNLVSSHNSLVASQNMLAALRIVCMNTVQASISDASGAGTASVIRHTLNSEQLITPEKFASDLSNWIAQRNQFTATLEALRATPMNLDGFRAFAAGVFTTDGAKGSDQLSTVSWNRIGEMESLFARGKGNSGVSAYDAINAFTEYFTSGNGVGKPTKNGTNLAKRIASANFGRGNEWKLQALACAADEDTLTDTIKRGAILFNDKLIERAAKGGDK